MLSDSKKNLKHNILRGFLFHAGGVLVVVLMVLLVIANVKIYKKKQEFAAKAAELKSQIEEIKKRNSDLSQGIENSNNEDYVEKVAREELDLQKPGEKTVSFIMPQDTAQKTSTPTETKKQSWWSMLWDLIFK